MTQLTSARTIQLRGTYNQARNRIMRDRRDSTAAVPSNRRRSSKHDGQPSNPQENRDSAGATRRTLRRLRTLIASPRTPR